jgi:hypothetical protein
VGWAAVGWATVVEIGVAEGCSIEEVGMDAGIGVVGWSETEGPDAQPVALEASAGAALSADAGATVRSLKQYRHLIASSWISSAQYGHFFTAPPFRKTPE